MALKIEKTPIPISQIMPKLYQDGFIIYAGAGISIPPPTCAPSWWTLTEEILQAFFNRVPEDSGLPGDLIIKSEIWQPEVIFENFAKLFDTHLYKVFPALDVAQSNGNHKIIARLAKIGVLKACFTTNFDIYIEKALIQEGVDFDVIIDNEQYDELSSKLSSKGFGSKFLLCKIHGTTERPETIVSVASAYKSSKGFSPPKSQVLNWLMKRYPVLFLGYSGWDFEHNNYRKFWDRTGPVLKHIYWNRRPGEEGGPNFDTIFNSCKNKFQFCEADLPSGWLDALQQNSQFGLGNIDSLKDDLSASEELWDSIKGKREEFLKKWAFEISDASTLAAVITEGIHFSNTFRTKMEKMKHQQAKQSTVSPEKMAALTQKNSSITTQMQNLALSVEERAKLMDEMFYVQLDMQTAYCQPDEQQEIKLIFQDNKYPGISDNAAYRSQLSAKIMPLIGRFPITDAIRIAIEFTKKDVGIKQKQSEMQIAGKSMQEVLKFAEAEMSVNQAIYGIMVPDEEKWKPIIPQMESLKKQYLADEIDKTHFLQGLNAICEKSVRKSQGIDIPVQELLEKLILNVSSAESSKQFLERCKALFLAVTMAAANINAQLMKTPEAQALVKAMSGYTSNVPAMPDPALIQKIQQEMAIKMKELQTLMQSGEIDGAEYGKRMQSLVSENQKRYQPQKIEQTGEDGQVEVPISILTAYDNKIREIFQPVFDTETKFEGDNVSQAEILIEIGVMGLWLTIAQTGDAETGKKFQQIMGEGNYPIVKGNASVFSFLMGKNKAWIEKALIELPARFGQQLCSNLITIAKLTNDIELCKRATLRSLEYTEGKVVESTAYEVPYVLAQFYENSGDEINALKFWNLALDGVRTAVPPAFTDVILYHAAKLTAKQGDKESALKMIGRLHPKYLGNEPPFKTAARDMSINLAQSLAADLGFMSVEIALESLLDA